MDARQSRSIKKTSKKQENLAAEEIGGKTQAASGATKFGGGDVRAVGKYRVECKFTNKVSYTLKLSELEKLRKQANAVLEYPIFQFCFRSHLGKLERPYAVIPWDIRLDPSTELIVNAKQYGMGRDLLTGIGSNDIVKIKFITKDIVKEFRIMLWDDLIEKLNAESNA